MESNVCIGVIATPRYQDNLIEEDNHSPGFLTIGQKYSIAIGSTVVLPCKINETGKTHTESERERKKDTHENNENENANKMTGIKVFI